MLAAAATILATCPYAQYRDGVEAMRLANRLAQRNGPDHVPSLNLLAAALAESQDFQGAIDASQRALELARRDGDDRLAEIIESRLDLYRSGQPFHQGADPAGN